MHALLYVDSIFTDLHSLEIRLRGSVVCLMKGIINLAFFGVWLAISLHLDVVILGTVGVLQLRHLSGFDM